MPVHSLQDHPTVAAALRHGLQRHTPLTRSDGTVLRAVPSCNSRGCTRRRQGSSHGRRRRRTALRPSWRQNRRRNSPAGTKNDFFSFLLFMREERRTERISSSRDANMQWRAASEMIHSPFIESMHTTGITVTHAFHTSSHHIQQYHNASIPLTLLWTLLCFIFVHHSFFTLARHRIHYHSQVITNPCHSPRDHSALKNEVTVRRIILFEQAHFIPFNTHPTTQQ